MFCCSPAYAFSGRPPGGAGCRERSQRSCLRPGGLPSLTRTPWLAATVPVAPPLSRRDLRSRHPGKRPPGCKGQRRFAHALFVVAAGPCPLLCPVPHTRMSPCRRGHRQPQPSPPVQG
ncbi:hypothetical protein B6Q59_22580 [Escherichia coli]|nr:hypothetical protein [Escherichia coli]EFO2867678.1 hypothetical protein [Escherichia coli]PSZ77384.1 hypothetical protein C9E20_24625 [Escherichia coli]